ncbi:MAG: HD domain-containing protein, partial [Fibrobacterota bacterium]|nr:HD domain-containing protein [Chitinispirillaceae bacterium]
VAGISKYGRYIDTILGRQFADNFNKNCDDVALVATGGYGRNELCPYSDIDLLILHEGDHTKEGIARIVRALWDLGLPLGCVVRSVSECAQILGEDIATDTSLLDIRLITGSRELYKKLIRKTIDPSFRKRKRWFLKEIEDALKAGVLSADTSLYTVEPHLKNGVCTLRDCQRIIWGYRVSESMYGRDSVNQFSSFGKNELQSLQASYITLLKMRCALHMTSKARLDILEFSQQAQVADYIGIGESNPGVLMETFFRTVMTVKQHVLKYLEQHGSMNSLAQMVRWYFSSVKVGNDIVLLDGYLSCLNQSKSSHSIQWIMDVYLLSIHYQAFPASKLENKIREIVSVLQGTDIDYSVIGKQFVELMTLKQPVSKVLRSMYETGFLELLFPELSSIKCKVEYDSYHEFTVDQHTLHALSIVDSMGNENDPLILGVYKSIDDIFTLRMALLFHDIGKSLGVNHAETGAVIAKNACDRLGVDEKKRDTITFLVEHHLELSMLAFRREPEDHTIAEFAEVMRNQHTLDLLFMLTIVDIRSVGRKTWTVWKGIQLCDVYNRIKHYISGNTRFRTNEERIQDNLLKDIKKYASMFERLNDAAGLCIEVEKFTGFERLIVCGHDRLFFFADLAGCLSSEGYNILSAQLSTIDGKVFDIFYVETDTVIRISSEQHIKNIYRKWDSITKGQLTTKHILDERYRVYPPKPIRKSGNDTTTVHIDNKISREFTVIEIRTNDRFGLLYTVAQALSQLNVDIVSAKLSTRVSQAVDVFYVHSAHKQKIENIEEIHEIKNTLIQLCTA